MSEAIVPAATRQPRGPFAVPVTVSLARPAAVGHVDAQAQDAGNLPVEIASRLVGDVEPAVLGDAVAVAVEANVKVAGVKLRPLAVASSMIANSSFS